MINEQLLYSLKKIINSLIDGLLESGQNTQTAQGGLVAKFTDLFMDLSKESGKQFVKDLEENKYLKKDFKNQGKLLVILLKTGYLDAGIFLYPSLEQGKKFYKTTFEKIEQWRLLENITKIQDVRIKAVEFVFHKLQVFNSQNPYYFQFEICKNAIWQMESQTKITLVDHEVGISIERFSTKLTEEQVKSQFSVDIYMAARNFSFTVPQIIVNLGLVDYVLNSQYNPNTELLKILRFNYWINQSSFKEFIKEKGDRNLSFCLFKTFCSTPNIFFRLLNLSFIFPFLKYQSFPDLVSQLKSSDIFLQFMERGEEIFDGLNYAMQPSTKSPEILRRMQLTIIHDLPRAQKFFSTKLCGFYKLYSKSFENKDPIFYFFDECYQTSPNIFAFFEMNLSSEKLGNFKGLNLDFKSILKIFRKNPSRAEILLSEKFLSFYSVFYFDGQDTYYQMPLKNCSPEAFYNLSMNDPELFWYIVNNIDRFEGAIRTIRLQPIDESWDSDRETKESCLHSMDFNLILSLGENGIEFFIKKSQQIAMMLREDIHETQPLRNCFEHTLRIMCRQFKTNLPQAHNSEPPSSLRSTVFLTSTSATNSSLDFELT